MSRLDEVLKDRPVIRVFLKNLGLITMKSPEEMKGLRWKPESLAQELEELALDARRKTRRNGRSRSGSERGRTATDAT